MKKTFQSLVSGVLIGLLSVGLYCLPVYAINGDILTFTGSGSLNNTEVFRVGVDGAVYSSTGTVVTDTSGNIQTRIGAGDIYNVDDVFMQGANSVIQFGDAAGLIAVSTAITSGNSQGISYPYFLTGIVATVEGSVVCASTAASPGSVAQGISVVVCSTDVARRGDVVGVARTAVSTGSVVEVFGQGSIALVFSSGTVVAGDILITTITATPGMVAAYERGTVLTSTNAVVGIALAGGISTGGLVKARLVR